jgi:hypothetical protein
MRSPRSSRAERGIRPGGLGASLEPCWRSPPSGAAIIGNAPVKIAIEAAVRWG